MWMHGLALCKYWSEQALFEHDQSTFSEDQTLMKICDMKPLTSFSFQMTSDLPFPMGLTSKEKNNGINIVLYWK